MLASKLNLSEKTARTATRAAASISAGRSTESLHHLAFDNSALANIISEVKSGHIITANKAACKLLGYCEPDMRNKKRMELFNIAEEGFIRMMQEREDSGSSRATVTVTRSTGRQIVCEITSSVFHDGGMEKAITTIVDRSQSIARQKRLDATNKKRIADDISLLQEQQKMTDRSKARAVAADIVTALELSDSRLARQEEDHQHFLLDAHLSVDVIWDWKIAANKTYLGEGYEALFGYGVADHISEPSDWSDRLHPEDRALAKKTLGMALASDEKHWLHRYRLARADGSFAQITDRGCIFRDEEGKPYRMIGVMQDTSPVPGIPETTSLVILDKKQSLVQRIKKLLVRLIRHSDEQLLVNFSDYIAGTLGYDYKYLSGVFSAEEGVSIQQFTIAQKIERAKELMLEGASLSDIAFKLHYSSVAHLSKQFKKAAGLTPSAFRGLHQIA